MLHFKENNVTVFQSALYMTTSAIIESGQAMLLTDPNWLSGEVQEIRDYIDQHLGDRDLYIIYTHSDFDHVIGSGAFPEAKVIATEELKNHPDQEKIVKRIHDFDQGYYIKRNYVPVYPKVDIPIVNSGEKVHIGDLTLTFYKAPGHTNDSLFTVVEPYGILIAGDYLSDVEFPFIFSGYKDYVNTINHASSILDKFDINYLIPGHGSVTKDKQEMLHRINFSKHYLKELTNETGDLENECRTKYQFFEGMKSIHSDNKRIAIEECKDKLMLE